jgi:hypothetical protein
VTAQCNDVTVDLIAHRVLMREIESHSADKDAARFEKHQSTIIFQPGLTVTMLQLLILFVLTFVGAVVTAGKYGLSYPFNVLTVYSFVQCTFQS